MQAPCTLPVSIYPTSRFNALSAVCMFLWPPQAILWLRGDFCAYTWRTRVNVFPTCDPGITCIYVFVCALSKGRNPLARCRRDGDIRGEWIVRLCTPKKVRPHARFRPVTCSASDVYTAMCDVTILTEPLQIFETSWPRCTRDVRSLAPIGVIGIESRKSKDQ